MSPQAKAVCTGDVPVMRPWEARTGPNHPGGDEVHGGRGGSVGVEMAPGQRLNSSDVAHFSHPSISHYTR